MMDVMLCCGKLVTGICDALPVLAAVREFLQLQCLPAGESLPGARTGQRDRVTAAAVLMNAELPSPS